MADAQALLSISFPGTNPHLHPKPRALALIFLSSLHTPLLSPLSQTLLYYLSVVAGAWLFLRFIGTGNAGRVFHSFSLRARR